MMVLPTNEGVIMEWIAEGVPAGVELENPCERCGEFEATALHDLCPQCLEETKASYEMGLED